MIKWAFAASLILIFAITTAILNTISDKLLPTDIHFGDLPDKAAKCLIAAFAGFVIAGVVLTAAAMMPIDAKLPYERFSAVLSRSTRPGKTLILNADGFVTGFASWVSRGSMSGQKSLAVFHPDLLNEIYLNRIGSDKENSALAGSESAVSVETALTPQTPLVSAADNQPIQGEGSRTKAVIIKTAAEGSFTMSQIRLVCKAGDSANNLQGSGQVVWPIGYISRDNLVDLKGLTDKIITNRLDLVFYIPADTVPVMLQYKQNAVATVGKLESQTTPPPQTPAEQAPAQQTPAEQNSTQK
jgi:hypothetical protein